MKAIYVAVLATLACSIASHAGAQSTSAATADRAAIDHLLQTSAMDWSKGDLPAFMRSYENAPATAFVTSSGLIKGFEALQSHYAANYASGTKKMGRLALMILDDRTISADYALVTGRFTLTRPAADGGNATGIFTLLMHRTGQGWLISYDHTS